MTRKTHPSNNTSPGESYYDLIDDYHLIASSFLKQYGIKLNKNEITWQEFIMYLQGLTEDTPLAKIVAIRSENDPEVLKNFNAEQRRIRNEWRNKDYNPLQQLTLMQDMLIGMCGGTVEGKE